MAAATAGGGASGGAGPFLVAAPAPRRAPAAPPGAGACATRATVSGPRGASVAAVTLTAAFVPVSPITDSATLRPVGGDRAASVYFVFSGVVRTTWSGTST